MQEAKIARGGEWSGWRQRDGCAVMADHPVGLSVVEDAKAGEIVAELPQFVVVLFDHGTMAKALSARFVIGRFLWTIVARLVVIVTAMLVFCGGMGAAIVGKHSYSGLAPNRASENHHHEQKMQRLTSHAIDRNVERVGREGDFRQLVGRLPERGWATDL